MSVWKSPVFYFGILLLAVVGGLMVAPYVVDWNSYKDNLEAYGRRLTGRNVEIGGDVEIRLFPWPRLTAQQVAIGNPEGIDGAPLIHSEGLTLSLQLGGLLNGNLNVESVELLEPKVTLLRTFLACISVVIVINLFLTPMWLNIMYGNAFVISGARLIKNAIKLPVDTLLLFTVLKVVENRAKNKL